MLMHKRIMFDDQIASQLCKKNSQSKFWSYVKNKNRKGNDKVSSIITDQNNMTINTSEVANVFNAFFHSCFIDPSNCTPVNHDIFGRWHSVLNYPAMISQDEILIAIKNTKVTRSASIDGIPSDVYFYCADVLVTLLFHLFNLILSATVIPQDWKISRIVPILKKSRASSITEFRPISILSPISKIFEKVIYQRLMTFINDKNLICNQQFGFHNKLSTCDNLLSVTNYLMNELNNNNMVDIIYFDYHKAFDSVNHTKLIHKLYTLGFNECYINLIQNYLSNRWQATSWKGNLSTLLPCISGILQGSLLGPLLFILFINDIPGLLTCRCALYADDIKLFLKISKNHHIEDRKLLQVNVNTLLNWSQMWDLPINYNKCFHVTYCKKAAYNSHQFPAANFKLDNCVIQTVNEITDLGVIYDKHINFKSHIDHIISRANHSLFTIMHAFKFSSSSIHLHLYKSFVLPQLEYCSPVWNPNIKRYSAMIERVQRHALRYITNSWSKRLLGYADCL